MVNTLLQFVVKNHAEISPTLAFDLFGCRVVHPIQVGIVVGFTRLGKAVMDSLIFRNALRGGQNQMALLRQGEEAARTGVGMRDPFCDKTLADEVLTSALARSLSPW